MPYKLPEDRKRYFHDYYLANKDKIKKKVKVYYRAHRIRIRSQAQDRYVRNKLLVRKKENFNGGVATRNEGHLYGG